MPLLDFNLQKIGIVIDNDSICSILFDLSVTTSKNGTETNPISFTIVKDMAMSKLEGEDVFKELVDYKKSFVITEENIKRDIDFYTNTSINPSPKQAEQFVYNNIYERVLENGNLMP